MKVIIVDDERRTRKFLGMAIDWASLGVTTILEAADGEEAYRMILEQRPEIILTDMRMPNKDGVELLSLLRELPYPHKTIVISGYDDYVLLKKTIEYGGYDYFIKPIDETEVETRLREAIKELERDTEKAAQALKATKAVNERKRLLRDSLMTQIVDSTSSISTYDDSHPLADEWGHLKGRNYTLCICRVHPNVGRVERMFSDRMDLFYFSVANVAEELFDFPREGTAFRYLSREGVIVLLLFKPESAAALCRELSRAMSRTFGINVEISVAPRRDFPSSIAESFEDADAIMEGINHLQPNRDGVYEKLAEHAEMQSLLQEERKLVAILTGRNEADLKRFISELFAGCLEAGSLSKRQIHWWEQELRWLKELYAGSVQRTRSEPAEPVDRGVLVYWDDAGVFSMGRLADSLESQLVRLSADIGLLRGRERKETIYEIRDYLKQRFHEPLLIKDLSALFFMNPEYVARLFKQEFEIGIKEFVSELRIGHAKLLLGNPYLKIGAIADKVGFADEKYFSKTFKKATGLTPQQYRKSDKGG